MPTGRVKWFSLEKGFGFIANDEGEDVYLAASSLPEGVATVKPGTKLEFSIADSRRGPQSPLAQAAPKPCHSCGFFLPIAGSLRATFGVCANAISPDDARVVSVDHGCGAHSEATFTDLVIN